MIDSLWPLIEPALTPALVVSVAITIAATHLIKIIAEHWYPDVTQSASRWRAFCASVSLIAGLVVGLGAWLGTDMQWWAVPIVAFGAGPAWAIARRLVPARARGALLTATDRRYAGKETP